MAYRRRKKGLLGLFGRRGGYYRTSRWSFSNLFSVFNWNISSETKKGIFTIFLFVLAALSILGLFDLAGPAGKIIVMILALLFGGLKWLFPILALVFVYFLLRKEKYDVKSINYIGAFLLVLGLTALWHLMKFDLPDLSPAAQQSLGGGYIGLALSWPLWKLAGFWGAFLISLAVFLIGVLLTFETSLHGLMWPVKFFGFISEKIGDLIISLKDRSASRRVAEPEYEEDDEDVEEEDVPTFAKGEVGLPTDSVESEAREDKPAIAQMKRFGKKIELPLELLTARSGKPTSGDIKANQETIRKTLANFGIEVEMGDVNVGPTVTQYTFRPAEGVKLSRIVNLNSDLALALAAHPIRIEAPIPSRSLVGVEVPNQLAARVTMNEMLSDKTFKARENNLSFSLGKDVSGKPQFAQLDKMPHLLIAGATGSGKSVCINSIIISLLYQNSPDDLKFILIDPKRVELPIYNGIPYLLTPVITDVKKTINALKWATVEMERRFELLSKLGKRNIASFNQGKRENLPYIVIIVDELADLMSTASGDVEAGIVRLAQMARAVGIHLILATQRPSVEVITGLIKANIPARIAFSVASLIDSRTILDSSGAEKLVGRGDMLYLGPTIAKPKRLQGVYLSDKEIKNVVDYIKSQGEAEYIDEVIEKQSRSGGFASAGFGSDDDGDALLGDAKEVIIQSGKASASLLQRRLKVGYARAARILDLLEDQGIIGPADGAKPREVFLDKIGSDVDLVEFAAREYDLEGELAEFQEEDEALEEAGEITEDIIEADETPAGDGLEAGEKSDTARDVIEEESNIFDDIADQEEIPEDESADEKELEEKDDDQKKDELEDELIKEEESSVEDKAEVEEDEEKDKKLKAKKRVAFDEDEWS